MGILDFLGLGPEPGPVVIEKPERVVYAQPKTDSVATELARLTNLVEAKQATVKPPKVPRVDRAADHVHRYDLAIAQHTGTAKRLKQLEQERAYWVKMAEAQALKGNS